MHGSNDTLCQYFMVLYSIYTLTPSIVDTLLRLHSDTLQKSIPHICHLWINDSTPYLAMAKHSRPWGKLPQLSRFFTQLQMF